MMIAISLPVNVFVSLVEEERGRKGGDRPVPPGGMEKVLRSWSPVAAIQAPLLIWAAVHSKTRPFISLMISILACDFIGDALSNELVSSKVREMKGETYQPTTSSQ